MKYLFSPPLARDKDPITSHLAAEKIFKSGKLSFQEDVVYDAVCDYVKYFHNDFTAKDIAERSNVNYYTIQRRFSGLRNKGKIDRLNTEGGIYIEGQELMRRNDCAVWVLL